MPAPCRMQASDSACRFSACRTSRRDQALLHTSSPCKAGVPTTAGWQVSDTTPSNATWSAQNRMHGTRDRSLKHASVLPGCPRESRWRLAQRSKKEEIQPSDRRPSQILRHLSLLLQSFRFPLTLLTGAPRDPAGLFLLFHRQPPVLLPRYARILRRKTQCPAIPFPHTSRWEEGGGVASPSCAWAARRIRQG
jgi:hypothetical protein